MKIVIAPDSLKGALSAQKTAAALKKGFAQVLPEADYVLLPVSDGGDGLVEILLSGAGGRKTACTVSDPLGRPVKAFFGLLSDGKTAVVEMAAASGLFLLKPAERAPLRTSTRGTGQLIAEALKRKPKQLIVGIGGSATVDGGLGMARALGVRFLDKKGAEIPEGGAGLGQLFRIDLSRMNAAVRQTKILVASDVRNPLVGKTGAAFVYGPQKGASPGQVRLLERNLRHFARIVSRDTGRNVAALPGAGAAGGLGAGLCAFLDARMQSGIELVLRLLDFRRRAEGASLILTGEGRIDGQVKFGKALSGIAAIGRELKIPVIAFCGAKTPDAFRLHRSGITAIFPILNGPETLEEAMAETAGNLLTAGREAALLVKAFYGKNSA